MKETAEGHGKEDEEDKDTSAGRRALRRALGCLTLTPHGVTGSMVNGLAIRRVSYRVALDPPVHQNYPSLQAEPGNPLRTVET